MCECFNLHVPSCYRVRLCISPIVAQVMIHIASMWRKSAKNISVSYLFPRLSLSFFLSLPPTPPSSINKKWVLRTSSPHSSLLSLIFLSLTRFAQGKLLSASYTHKITFIKTRNGMKTDSESSSKKTDRNILSQWHSRRWQRTCAYTPRTLLMMSWCFCLITECHCSVLVRAWVFLVFADPISH